MTEQHDMKWPDLPRPSPETELFVTNTFIGDSVAMLMRILAAIKKWEQIAWAEFEEWRREIEQKHPEGFNHGGDPISDEGIMSVYTEYALYGSLAVNIAALVEDQLPRLFRHGTTILKDGSNGKEAKRPHFADSMFTLETKCGCRRQDLAHYDEHLFVREMANRFKHSGGKSTQEFVDEFGLIAGVTRVDELIPYNQYSWEYYIQQSRELLIDVAKRIANSNE